LDCLCLTPLFVPRQKHRSRMCFFEYGWNGYYPAFYCEDCFKQVMSPCNDECTCCMRCNAIGCDSSGCDYSGCDCGGCNC
jgi:hypothetical protein